MTEVAPIVLFVYARPEHTRKTIEALAANPLAERSHLYVYADGPKTLAAAEAVAAARKIVKEARGFAAVELIERTENFGLARSVITGVTEVLRRHDRVIVLEDDIVTAPSFLTYANQMLVAFRDRRDVINISGYNYPIAMPATYPHSYYLSRRFTSWGWATWRDRWCLADWDVRDFGLFLRERGRRRQLAAAGEDLVEMLELQMLGRINSWAVRWAYTQCRLEGYCIHPTVSLVENIGHDGSGTHCAPNVRYVVQTDSRMSDFPAVAALAPEPEIHKILNKFFRLSPKVRVKRLIKRALQHRQLTTIAQAMDLK